MKYYVIEEDKMLALREHIETTLTIRVGIPILRHLDQGTVLQEDLPVYELDDLDEASRKIIQGAIDAQEASSP